jgi:hypothetical protein
MISDTYGHLRNVLPAIQQAVNVFEPTTQKIAVKEFHGDLFFEVAKISVCGMISREKN